MPVAIFGPRGHEIKTDDGTFQIRSESVPGYINNFKLEEIWTDGGIHPEDDAALEKLVPEEHVDWLRFVSPYFSGDIVKEQPRFEGLLEGLGFSLQQDEVVEQEKTRRVRHYQYPSVDRVNDFMDEAYGVDKAITLVPFDGAEYAAYEFIDRFSRKGEVLIANHQPHEVHDLSDHVLGWVGLDPTLVKFIRHATGSYLRRFEAEYNNPLVPLHDHESDKEAQEFLYPSLVAIKLAMRNLDILTSEVAYAALFEGDNYYHDSAEYRVQAAVENFFNTRTGNTPGLPKIPANLFGKTPDGSVHAVDILARYKKAAQVVAN